MDTNHPVNVGALSRRGFMQVVGGSAAAGLSLGATGPGVVASSVAAGAGEKGPATVRGAFVYPPTSTLDAAGYYSWPGSTFDAEGRQRQYMQRIRKIEADLGMRIAMDEAPLDDEASVNRFIDEVKSSRPDGLLLIPLKKGHWPHVVRIVETTGIPSVVLATLGVLLVSHINELHRKPGAYLISSMDNLDAVEYGMRMIRTARRMREGRILNIRGSERTQSTVPFLGTQVLTIPHESFYEEVGRTEVTEEVKRLAAAYGNNAKEVVQPSEADILEAARCYFTLKRLIESEHADALMMDCLPGLRKPHKHVPPCMGFMSLRDEGIPAGCQSDLNATLSLMLVQELFGRPGFQQNASMETESNHYFGAHCTSASRMNGPDQPAEPYMLMSHAEAGWGCVPRVLFAEGQEVTMAQYISGEKPRMLVYTGTVVRCPSIPPAGGCRTNIEMTINEVEDVCDVKGMHQAIFYGNYGKQLRDFCRLLGIEAAT